MLLKLLRGKAFLLNLRGRNNKKKQNYKIRVLLFRALLAAIRAISLQVVLVTVAFIFLALRILQRS